MSDAFSSEMNNEISKRTLMKKLGKNNADRSGEKAFSKSV